jgi:hypothetical protein
MDINRKDDPKSVWVTVTPELAKKYLEMNTINRPILPSRVSSYSSQMKAGDWDLTHQGIAFGRNGSLLDGQNRLMAVIESGKSVKMLVTTGLPYDTPMNVNIDRGLIRNNSVILGENSKIVQVANYLVKVLYGSLATKNSRVVGNVLDVFKPFIDNLHTACSSHVKCRSSVPVRAAACIRSITDEDVIHQYRAFVLLDAQIMWPSVLAFLKQVQNGLKGHGSDWQNMMAARAWIAFNPDRRSNSKIQITNLNNVFDDFRTSIKELL